MTALMHTMILILRVVLLEDVKLLCLISIVILSSCSCRLRNSAIRSCQPKPSGSLLFCSTLLVLLLKKTDQVAVVMQDSDAGCNTVYGCLESHSIPGTPLLHACTGSGQAAADAS